MEHQFLRKKRIQRKGIFWNITQHQQLVYVLMKKRKEYYLIILFP
ncbi:uncharacterized protein METZ01_LOCUS426883 [marine metagenome]|uniref:Uncharacterized protein n=1 Tax=marine metagenome TaxID=408172 RepID=A0A382XT37_9ZZZZ